MIDLINFKSQNGTINFFNMIIDQKIVLYFVLPNSKKWLTQFLDICFRSFQNSLTLKLRNKNLPMNFSKFFWEHRGTHVLQTH